MTVNLSESINAAVTKVISLKNAPERIHEKRLNDLKSSIEQAKTELNCAMENFNNVTEPKLIDFYIYKIQSEQNRYEQLLSEYKDMEGLPQTLE